MKRFWALIISLVLLLSAVPAMAEEKMEISYVGWNCAEIEEGNWAEKQLEEKFGVEIHVTRVDMNNAEQINLMLAAGEMPECGWMNYPSPTDYYQVQELSRLISEDMIRQYAPNYAAMLDADPIGWNTNYLKDENGYMALSGYAPALVRPMVAVRLDWLENLGLPIPEYQPVAGLEGSEYEGRIFYTDKQWTADELYTVLKAFTENDPDQNGKNDTYGLQVDAKDYFTWGAWYAMFSVANNKNYTYADEEGNADFYMVTEEYKNFLTYMSKLYAEGLMDKEYVSVERPTSWEKFANGSAGVMMLLEGFEYSTAAARPPYSPITNDPAAKTLVMPVCTAADGTFAVRPYSISNYNYNFIVRSDVSDEKLAKILEIFDYVHFDEEAQIKYRFGLEGEHFNYVNPETKSGGVVSTEAGYYGKDTGLYVFNCNYIQTPVSKKVMQTATTTMFNEALSKAYDGHMLTPYKLNMFTNSASENYEEANELYSAAVDTVVSEYCAAIITGEKTLADSWDAYLEELNAAGYGEMYDALNQLPTYEQFMSGEF